MDAQDKEEDVQRLLRRGYDAPPPREAFVENLLDQMKRELGAARRAGRQAAAPSSAPAPGKVARTLARPWRWVAVAASAVLAVGLAAVALHKFAPPATQQVPGAAPVVQGTPGEAARPPPAPGNGSQEKGPAEPKERLEPLGILLPKPAYICTPKHIPPRPTLEKPAFTRAPFFAPEGTRNIALGRPVTPSDNEPIIGEHKLVTDGDKEGMDGSFVEYGPGLQWVQIDLGKPCAIYAIVIWHYLNEARVYHDVVVQVSCDPDFIRGVQTVFNNDFDNSAGLGLGKDLEYIESYLGKLIDARGVRGRYVRLYSKGNTSNDLNHYIEVEVYGKPAAAPEREKKEPVAIRLPRPIFH